MYYNISLFSKPQLLEIPQNKREKLTRNNERTLQEFTEYMFSLFRFVVSLFGLGYFELIFKTFAHIFSEATRVTA